MLITPCGGRLRDSIPRNLHRDIMLDQLPAAVKPGVDADPAAAGGVGEAEGVDGSALEIGEKRLEIDVAVEEPAGREVRAVELERAADIDAVVERSMPAAFQMAVEIDGGEGQQVQTADKPRIHRDPVASAIVEQLRLGNGVAASFPRQARIEGELQVDVAVIAEGDIL